jgi:hypothetical protein
MRRWLADVNTILFESYDLSGPYVGKLLGVTSPIELTDSSSITVLEDATFFEEQ